MHTLPSFEVQVFRVRPEGFSASVEVSACYIEVGDKLLFLKRSPNKPQGNTWGVPADKLEEGETPHQALIREVFEETGLSVDPNKVDYLAPLYVRYPEFDFVYHMFHLTLDTAPAVVLSPNEHLDFCWISPSEATDLPLIPGAAEALHHVKAIAKTTKLKRKDFYFIRHGETDVNADPNIKRLDYDLPLNAKGRAQVHSMRETVARHSFKSVCYSPIQRAVETKEILVDDLNLSHYIVEGVTECKAHIWTRMVCLEEGGGYHICDEIVSFFNRVLEGINVALNQESPTLVVAHGGVHWALCYQMNITNHPWKVGNCKLVHFTPVGTLEWQARIIN